jgi:hypothetical protein
VLSLGHVRIVPFTPYPMNIFQALDLTLFGVFILEVDKHFCSTVIDADGRSF